MNKNIMIITIVAVVIAVVFFLLFLLPSSVENTANNFIKEIGEKKFERAYQLTTVGFKENTSLKQFKYFLINSKLIDNDEVKWSKINIDIKQCYLEGAMKTSNNCVIIFKIILLKEDDKWKVHLLELKNPKS